MAAALPAEAYVVALSSLPGMWPGRLAALLGQRRAGTSGDRGCGPLAAADEPRAPLRSPRSAWTLVRSGRADQEPALVHLLRTADAAREAAANWAAAAADLDVARLWGRHRRAGVVVDLLGAPGYPARLACDRAAPYVIFRVGRDLALDGPAVAIVGTRRCTAGGREVAVELGRGLAEAGARVVSGLALGIDGAAHQGVLAAGRAAPIGVVAGGFDRPYPARHRNLWAQVAEAGALVSEWPLGARSESWRFPARNRVIAALADAVVVVESRERGGSMITAEEALARGIPVLAVPGSIRNPACAGSNRLLRDGAAPACALEDVLAALALQAPAGAPRPDPRPPPPPAAGPVLAALGWEPTSIDLLLARTGLDPGSLAVQLAHLELDGWASGGAGLWQRMAAPEAGR